MNITENLIHLVEAFEGRRHTTYFCAANIPTIGIGHTNKKIYDFDRFSVWDDATIEHVFNLDISEAVATANKHLKAEIKPLYFDAYVDLTFNAGYAKSLTAYLNTYSYYNAREEFLKWIYVNKKANIGLIKRCFARYFYCEGDFITALKFAPDNCNATSNNLEPLNSLLFEHGFKVVSDPQWRFKIIKI